MSEGLELPQLLRKARKAAFNSDYAGAEELYAAVLMYPEMYDNLDIKMRYAYCAERAGNIEAAINYYAEIVETYRETGEVGAADSLQESIDQLKRGESTTAVREAQEQEAAEQPQAEAQAAAAGTAEAEPEKEATSAAEEAPVEAREAVTAAQEPLNDEALMQELCTMGREGHLYPSEELCHAGDLPDTLWLIVRGKLDVEMPDYEEKDVLFSPQGAMTLAGEIGFFTLQRRTATLIANSEVDYFTVPVKAINERRKTDAQFDHAMERLFRERWVEPVLSQHSVFERINDIDRKRLAGTFERITMEPGQTLIEAGAEHDGAYLLQSGTMFFMHHIDDGSQEMDESDDDSHLIGIHPGDMIHLGGLLRGYKSSYKVVTATPVQLLHLPKENFEPFTLRRPWIIQAILRYSRRPAHLQLMHPEDDYMWQANRNITLRRVV